jgi:hypothetical protein
MMRSISIEVPFEQLLESIDRLDFKERDLLRDRLIQREEEALVEQAEQVASEFRLPNLPTHLSYWSVDRVLDGLSRLLQAYEQRFGADSKTFYVTSKRGQEVDNPERAEWARLYEAYQRLRTAKRRVDIKAGRVVDPLLVGQIVSRQLTLAELEEKLRHFEKQHGMSSTEFYESFKQGKQGDSLETFEWVHAYAAYVTMLDHDRSGTSGNV